MNRLHLIILASLKKIDATSIPSAITLYELREYCNISQSTTTLYRSMKCLCDMKYVSEGLKTVNCHSYYINQNGIKILKEMI